ncbi:hypothetical protein STEG23_032702, partial [Scotinomys teguina]
VFGLLVWTLIAGTEYFRVPAFGWVMFVAVFYWVLTVFFLIVYITMTYTRIPQVPWTTVGLYFNGSAFLLYLSAAIVDASSVSPEKESHNFNSWAASSVILRLPGYHLLRWKHILQFCSLEIQDYTVTSSSDNGEENTPG